MSYNEWLDKDVLEDYLDGKLDSQTMYKVERISLEDPFVAEALAGLSLSPKRTQTLPLLQKQLKERVAEKPIERKRWTLTSHRLSIAAAAAVLFVTVSILFVMKENNRKELAAKQSKKVEVNVAPEVAQVDQKSNTDQNVASSQSSEKSNQPIDQQLVVDKNNKVDKELPSATVAMASPPAAKSKTEATSAEAIAAKKLAEREIQAKADETSALAARKAQASRTKPIVTGASSASILANKPIFTGRVLSKIDRLPIPGVTVKIAGSNQVATTNMNGMFYLPADSINPNNLTVSYLGYQTKVVPAKVNDPIEVLLDEANSSLSQVVIPAASNSNPATYGQPYASSSFYNPIGGWASFQSYLAKNNKLTKSNLSGKQVVLKFQVSADGAPINISIVKSQSKAMDAEAIRLIKEGAKWIPKDSYKQGEVQLVIKF